jgi:protein-S-isoprenylcysteine O-methyltransferase Ste14
MGELEEEIPELRQIYQVLLEDALAICEGLTGSVRHFLYFCLTLIVFGVVFAALGTFFHYSMKNSPAAISSWVMAAIVVIYAIILWIDYSRMRRRFADLDTVYQRVKQKIRDL